MMRRRTAIVMSLIVLASVATPACTLKSAGKFVDAPASDYVWTKATDHAAFPDGYNFPLFNVRNQLWVLRSEGNWLSADGTTWTKAELPALGLRTAYQQYVQFKDSIYALGTMEGDYQNLKVGSRIMKTSEDLKRWEQVAAQSELPARVFYGAAVFAGKIWMLGGFDGRNYFNDVWASDDGVKWQRVSENAPWSRRSGASVFVFQNKLWLLGGGVIDGERFKDVWSTTDGMNWRQESKQMSSRQYFGGSVVVYDNRIWMLGMNRNDGFENATAFSSDGVNWTEQKAPWTPRGGVATCVFDGKLFMTGGKYSITENGQIKFIYSNDVWYLTRARR
jgi:hypothetical protein